MTRETEGMIVAWIQAIGGVFLALAAGAATYVVLKALEASQ